jgi:hypothetical protein
MIPSEGKSEERYPALLEHSNPSTHLRECDSNSFIVGFPVSTVQVL